MQWDKSERNTSEKSTFSNLPKLEGEPPQIGGSTVSRSRGLENNFFLLLKPFSENSHTGDSKNVRFFSLEPFLAEKTAVKEKKARFDPFVPPTHFQQQVGWGTRLSLDDSSLVLEMFFFGGILKKYVGTWSQRSRCCYCEGWSSTAVFLVANNICNKHAP